MNVFPLPEEQRNLLLKLFQDPVTPVALARRAEILLGHSEGRTVDEIAASLGISPNTVQRWLRAYKKDGLDIFPVDFTESESKIGVTSPEPSPDTAVVPSSTTPEPIQTTPPQLPEDADHSSSIALDLFEEMLTVHQLPMDLREVLTAASIRRSLELNYEEVLSEETADFGFGVPTEFSEILEQLLAGDLGKSTERSVQSLNDLNLTAQQGKMLDLLFQLTEELSKSGPQQTKVEDVDIGKSWVQVVLDDSSGILYLDSLKKIRERWGKLTDYNLRVVTKKGLESGTNKLFPQKIKQPGIELDDPLGEAGRKILRHQFAAMLRHERGTRIGEDIEELHDMRVAVRRMRVCFEIFEGVYRKKSVQRHRRGLREVGRALGRVRDMDVFMEKAQRYMNALPEPSSQPLAPLMQHWKQQRESARKKMLTHLRSGKYHSFLEDFNTFVHREGMGLKDIDELTEGGDRVQHAAPRIIYTRLGNVRAYEPILSEATIEQFHQLRIEFKRLRYTVEYFREVLGPQSAKVIKTIKRVQDHLGDLNDADVACTILSDFLDDWEPQQQALLLHQRESPEPIVAYLAAKHAERHELMVSFGETWSKIDHPDFRTQLALAIAAL